MGSSNGTPSHSSQHPFDTRRSSAALGWYVPTQTAQYTFLQRFARAGEWFFPEFPLETVRPAAHIVRVAPSTRTPTHRPLKGGVRHCSVACAETSVVEPHENVRLIAGAAPTASGLIPAVELPVSPHETSLGLLPGDTANVPPSSEAAEYVASRASVSNSLESESDKPVSAKVASISRSIVSDISKDGKNKSLVTV